MKKVTNKRFKFLAGFLTLLFLTNVFVFTATADIKSEVYSKLRCCECGHQFETCNCAQGAAMKAYIDALLDIGLSGDEILLNVAKKYTLDSIIDPETKKEIEIKLIKEAGKIRPQIFIQPLTYNLGRVSKKTKELKFSVKLENRGHAILTLTDLKTSCGCTTVKFRIGNSFSPAFSMHKQKESPEWKADIPAGETGELIIVTDLNHPHVQTGHLVRSVEIKSNDPIQSSIKVRFEADIFE